jgi:hypothetical protein
LLASVLAASVDVRSSPRGEVRLEVQRIVQGKPVARRGRKARDLGAAYEAQTARLPRPRASRWNEVVTGEDVPGASHMGRNAGRIHGPYPRCWIQVVEAMSALKLNAYRLLLAVCALASSALVLEAGQRWK